MTKQELIILKQLNEIDDLKKRINNLETVLIECKALLINVEDVKIDSIQFIIQEIDKVIKE